MLPRYCHSILLAALLAGSSASGQTADDNWGTAAGTTLPPGLGDSSNAHGFGASVQGSLGTTNERNEFGYDAFSASLNFNLGVLEQLGIRDNGDRVNVSIGSAQWFTPPLADIYPQEALTEEERSFANVGRSINAPFVRISARFLNDRRPKSSDKDWNSEFPRIKDCYVKVFQNTATKADCEREFWLSIVRPALRKPALDVGAAIRVPLIGGGGIGAYDMFAVWSAGHYTFDYAVGVHFLHNTEPSLVGQNALTLSAGAFYDLSDSPRTIVLGLTLTGGIYDYYPRDFVRDEVAYRANPSTMRFDQVFSIAIPGGAQRTGIVLLGFRVSELVGVDDKTSIQGSLVLSTDVNLVH
ncbi:hypothetical protein KRR26_28565 [Corallococcus sp. M34]|uniref:hypothetical protein n=1 Tax=Citreicoccus inhibens TaxID=2849499 RepID=UPI001C2446E0|nr:hypothetical protein [Citreicoccus inhibens]MBU8899569.1 hypothetical protein [Citreicoccus inhibens]